VNRCRGVTRGQGGAIPREPSHYGAPFHCGGRRMAAGSPKSPNNITSTFFNTVHLLAKDLSFDHGGAKRASCPRRHLTSLWPCTGGMTFVEVLKATAILACFENFLKSRYTVIGKSAVTLYIFCCKRKEYIIFSWILKTCSNMRFVPLTGAL